MRRINYLTRNCMIDLKMESLPAEICLKIFCLLDSHNLASAIQEMELGEANLHHEEFHGYNFWKWNSLASDNILWSNLFKERWGEDHATFYHPVGSKSWKDVYEVQDRCDRFGLGQRIVREGSDYYLIHQGEIQRHLGSRRQKNGQTSFLPLSSKRKFLSEGLLEEDKSCHGILDRILFFIGDLEVASTDAKRRRVL